MVPSASAMTDATTHLTEIEAELYLKEPAANELWLADVLARAPGAAQHAMLRYPA